MNMDKFTITIHVHPEPEHPKDHFEDWDNSPALRNLVDPDLNPWSWCCVEVRASLPCCPFHGKAFLGCCSYPSEQGFREGGYFEDMALEAAQDLITSLELASNALNSLEESP